jgi:hypothetical protein
MPPESAAAFLREVEVRNNPAGPVVLEHRSAKARLASVA